VLFGLIAVVLILLCALVWLNILMVRRQRVKMTESEQSRPEEATEFERDALGSSNNAHLHAPKLDGSAPTLMRRSAASTGSDAVSSESVPAQPEPAVEVIRSGRGLSSNNHKMFQRSSRPYVLHNATVPAFESDSWHECFMRLSGDADVMGWIGFEDDAVGACDRDYDTAFLEVLRGYRRSVEKLQREVGLSQVLETSVVGREGKIWFIAGVQDVWFALFVDRDADVHTIAQQFKEKLLSLGSSPPP